MHPSVGLSIHHEDAFLKHSQSRIVCGRVNDAGEYDSLKLESLLFLYLLLLLFLYLLLLPRHSAGLTLGFLKFCL